MAKRVISEVSPVAAAVAELSPVQAVLVRHEESTGVVPTPPQKIVDKAAPAKARPNPNIVPKGAGVDQRVNLTITSEAKGTVLAERFFACVQGQGNELRDFLKQIANLSLEGHGSFQARLKAHRQEANDYVNGRKGRAATANKEEIVGMRPAFKAGTDKHREGQTIARSGFTRISEAIRFSMACAKGHKVADWTASYHVLVVKARTFYDKAVGKNKPAKAEQTPVEKALAYIERMGLTKRQIHALVSRLDEAEQA